MYFLKLLFHLIYLFFILFFSAALMSMKSKMTDSERDQIDVEVGVFKDQCEQLLRKYRNECKYYLIFSK